MSLPSSATFLKDGLVVGYAFVNCGWFCDGAAIVRCLMPAWEDALNFFKHDPEEMPVNQRAMYDRDYKPWFTTKQDLHDFDHVCLYSMIFPKSVYYSLQNDEGFRERLVMAINCGQFKDTDNERKTAFLATKTARGID